MNCIIQNLLKFSILSSFTPIIIKNSNIINVYCYFDILKAKMIAFLLFYVIIIYIFAIDKTENENHSRV